MNEATLRELVKYGEVAVLVLREYAPRDNPRIVRLQFRERIIEVMVYDDIDVVYKAIELVRATDPVWLEAEYGGADVIFGFEDMRPCPNLMCSLYVTANQHPTIGQAIEVRAFCSLLKREDKRRGW